MIEEDFINRNLSGPDHCYALEPQEMSAMPRVVRGMDATPARERLQVVRGSYGNERVNAIPGHGREEIMPAEELYPCDKRSFDALKRLQVGDTLTPDIIRILRSERNLRPGLNPRYWEHVLGTQVAQSISEGDGLAWEHLLSKAAS